MLHDRTRTQRLACLATLAFVGLLVFQPIMLLAITTTAGNSHLVSLLFEFFPTGFLIGVIYSKIQDIHSLKYYICLRCKYNEYLRFVQAFTNLFTTILPLKFFRNNCGYTFYVIILSI